MTRATREKPKAGARLGAAAVACTLALGAAQAAHLAIFAGGHAFGAEFHFAVAVAGLLLAVTIAIGAAATALRGAGTVTSGSILAARLAAGLPARSTLTGATGLAFATIESLEPAHALAVIPALAAIACAAALVHAVAHAALGVLAAVAFALVHPRAIVMAESRRVGRSPGRPIAAFAAPSFRRFARPPPIAA